MIPFIIGFLIGSWLTDRAFEKAASELQLAIDQIEAYANKGAE